MQERNHENLIRLVSTQSARRILEDLIPEIQRQLGVRIEAGFIGVSVLNKIGTRTIEADVFVGPSDTVGQYVMERRPLSFSRVGLAISRSGAAFRSSEPLPDVSSLGKCLEFLEKAESVAYSEGISGKHLLEVLAKYGLDEAVGKKRVLPETGGSAATCVVLGLADVGIQQVSEMISVDGVTIVELPGELSKVASYEAVARRTGDSNGGAARILDYLTSGSFRNTLGSYGLLPPSLREGYLSTKE
ncbi:molybdate ABC transporter substrate-binding protein [Variovorax sp. Root434]|uniref:molybdate ABC transporter substrate-binding protein n=1 Tax=Variovorax sp. Root434 TaxID=1736536 RepID=UPI00138F46A6|nr:substrate-binding domain-containing protein [Variovorax sp. Root434]